MKAQKFEVPVKPEQKVTVEMSREDAEELRREILALHRYSDGQIGMSVNCPSLMKLNGSLWDIGLAASDYSVLPAPSAAARESRAISIVSAWTGIQYDPRMAPPDLVSVCGGVTTDKHVLKYSRLIELIKQALR